MKGLLDRQKDRERAPSTHGAHHVEPPSVHEHPRDLTKSRRSRANGRHVSHERVRLGACGNPDSGSDLVRPQMPAGKQHFASGYPRKEPARLDLSNPRDRARHRRPVRAS